jgi:hypothetical protein
MNAKLRFKTIVENEQNREVIVGRKGERVIAFEFRNDGTNSRAIFHHDGAGPSLLPGDEKVYAMDGTVFFHQSFLVKFEAVDGSQPATHRVLVTEMYLTNEREN